jgi:hypothetical protein
MKPLEVLILSPSGGWLQSYPPDDLRQLIAVRTGVWAAGENPVLKNTKKLVQ